MEVRVIIQKSLVSGLSPASAWALQLPPHPTARLAPHPHPQHTFSLTHRLATDRDQEGHCAKPRPLEWLHCSWAEFPEPAGAALTRAGLCSVRCPRAAGQGLTTPGRTPLLPSSLGEGGEEPQSSQFGLRARQGSPEDTSWSPLSLLAPERPARQVVDS